MNNPNERKGFTFYRSFSEAIALLPEAEQLAAYKAITAYALDAVEPDVESLPLMVQMLWKAFLPNLESDRRRYINGSKGGAPKGNQNARKNNSEPSLPEEQNNQETTDNQPQNNQKTSNVNVNVKENANENVNVEGNVGESSPIAQNAQHFKPPTINDIEIYIKKQGFADIDAQRFADYYASVGWRVGGQPMHDWRAALRRWHTRNKQNNNNLKLPKNEPKHTPTNPTNSPRLFRNLADDDYLADAHPRLGTAAAHNPRDSRKAAH